jgi:RNA polymerase sigma-70 factor (ECF subfamily)
MKSYSGQQSEQPLTDDHTSSSANETLLKAVVQARAGVDVEENFRIIAAWLSPRLLSYFRKHYFSHEAAEDLVQTTLMRVYKNIGQLEQAEKFLAWLFKIARNVRCAAIGKQLYEMRYLAGDLEQAEELPDTKPASRSPDRKIEEEERLKRMWAAIESLPPRQRQCFLLKERDELSYEEIAETLQLSVNTVRNHLAEARKSLRRTLKMGN